MTHTSFDIPSSLRDRLAEVLRNAVTETFHVVFGVDAFSREPGNTIQSEKDMVCQVKLVQNDLQFHVYFRFSYDLLQPIVSNFYPPEVISEQSSYEDAACEIANIVGCNLKAFLNSQGYNLEMQIPFTAEDGNAHDSDADALHLCFSAFSEFFSVNLQLTGGAKECA